MYCTHVLYAVHLPSYMLSTRMKSVLMQYPYVLALLMYSLYLCKAYWCSTLMYSLYLRSNTYAKSEEGRSVVEEKWCSRGDMMLHRGDMRYWRSALCEIHAAHLCGVYCAGMLCRNAFLLCSYCVPTVFLLCSYCVPTAFLLCSYCVPTVKECIPTQYTPRKAHPCVCCILCTSETF